MRRRHQILAGASAAVVLLGGYTTLDVLDHVPGLLTTADAPRQPVPAAGRSEPPKDVRRPSAPEAPARRVTSTGSQPDPAAIRAAVAPLLKAKGLGPTTSMTVRDGPTGTHLLDVDADAAHTPASITKLLSTYAVATTLGVDRTLKTSAVEGASGEVVLLAGGDTALATGEGDPDAVAGHAGLADLARQVATTLRKAGRTTVRVGWDLSYAPGPPQAKTWDQNLVDRGFTTRIGMLGLASDRSDPGHAPPKDPAKSATQAFVKALQKHGISATLGRKTTAPKQADQLGAVRSAPLGDVIGLAMRASDNAMTESLTRQAAASDGVAGDTVSVTQWVLQVLREDGIDVRGVRLKDLSGLADGTTIPARVVADVLMRGVSGKVQAFQDVIAQLPTAGWNGTLDDRFLVDRAHDGAGIVRAKTGSLPDVSSLAGTVVTKDGRLLVFTIINNGKQPSGPLQARADLDRIIAALARCGCGSTT